MGDVLEILKVSVKCIEDDDGFKIQSNPAETVLRAGKKVMEWLHEAANESKAEEFCGSLHKLLSVCLLQSGSKIDRERMWIEYHKLRVSPEFKELWKQFLAVMNVDPHPMLYQYVTDKFFQEMISRLCTINQSTLVNTAPISYEESNALRYIAGYVCSKVEKKFRKSSHVHKDEILLCFMDIKDEEDNPGLSADWLQTIDRGGLYRVNEETFMVFYEMETNLRKLLNTLTVQQREMTTDLRVRLHSSITSDDNVGLHWSMVTAEVDEEPAKVLLGELAHLYISVRGFSFTKTIVERYKQKAKKSTQKSKALRKTL